MKVSVIATVKNEGESIRKLLDSLGAQTRWPDEVVIVDAGSTDDTVGILKAYTEESSLPLRVLVRPGCNISEGRNTAIAEAGGEIIASTDAGVRLSPNWLEDLMRPFEEGIKIGEQGSESGYQIPETRYRLLDTTGQMPIEESQNRGADIWYPEVVSGFFLPDPQTVFESAMGATVLPALEDIDPQRFLPSSRSVAFRKEAWERAGRYPEWLDYCEDLIFDFRLRELYGPFPFAPRAIAYFRPRCNLQAFFLQYFRYSRGDGKADLWRIRHAIRYFTYLFAVPILSILGLRWSPLSFAPLFVGAVAYLWGPYRRLRSTMTDFSLSDKVRAVLWVPVIRITGDVAKMIGYPVGWVWRWKHLKKTPDIRWR